MCENLTVGDFFQQYIRGIITFFCSFFSSSSSFSIISSYLPCIQCFYLTRAVSQVTTKVNKPVDIPPPPVKKTRPLVPTPRSRGVRLSVPWVNGAICTPVPEEDVIVLEGEEEDDGVEVEVLEDRRDTASLYQQVCSVVVSDTVVLGSFNSDDGKDKENVTRK